MKAVDVAQENYERELRASGSADRRPRVLIDEWNDWPPERRSETLRLALDSVYVRKGRDNLDDRIMIVWDGQDDFERPQRGGNDYRVQPIPWPEKIDDPHASDVPGLAQRLAGPSSTSAPLTSLELADTLGLKF